MNHSLRSGRDHTAANSQMAVKISEQLESVNKTILLQNSLLELQQQQIETEQARKKRGLTPVLQTANLIISSVGIVVIIIFTHYTYQLSRITGRLVNSKVQVKERAMTVIPSSYRSPAQIEDAERTQAHLAKLDTLISEQTQSLKELKKLNTASVRAFMLIRKRLDRADISTMPPPGIRDSMSIAR